MKSVHCRRFTTLEEEKPLEHTAPLRTAPRTIVAYHGCSRETAKKILEGNRFVSSANAYDWLGEGVYFFEYAPYRALNWAIANCARSGGEPAVIGATIRLGRCLNLLDTAHAAGLVRSYERTGRKFGPRNMPHNTAFGAHFLDCEVVNDYSSLVKAGEGRTFQTVRGCYPEGKPVYEGSKILSLTHVQIAVRDPACISRVHLVQFP